jgi:hypothetical protein
MGLGRWDSAPNDTVGSTKERARPPAALAMAVMAWRRERFELLSKDALIEFLLLAEGHQPDRSDRTKIP